MITACDHIHQKAKGGIMPEIISVPEYYITVCPCCLAKIKFNLKSIHFERIKEEITRGLIRCCNCNNEIPVAYNNKELTENVIADKYVDIEVNTEKRND